MEFARYVQLATVSPDGFPSVRTIVWREWLDKKYFISSTDARSKKMEDVKHQPVAEVSEAPICLFFSIVHHSEFHVCFV